MVDRQHIVDTLNRNRFAAPGVADLLSIVEAFCKENNVDDDKVKNFIMFLYNPSNLFLLVKCYEYAIEHYEIKFNICELVKDSQVILYY